MLALAHVSALDSSSEQLRVPTPGFDKKLRVQPTPGSSKATHLSHDSVVVAVASAAVVAIAVPVAAQQNKPKIKVFRYRNDKGAGCYRLPDTRSSPIVMHTKLFQL